MTFDAGPYDAALVAEFALATCKTDRGYIRSKRGSQRNVSIAVLRSYLQTGEGMSQEVRDLRATIPWEEIVATCTLAGFETYDLVASDELMKVMGSAYTVVVNDGAPDGNSAVMDAINALGDRSRHLERFDGSNSYPDTEVDIALWTHFENRHQQGIRLVGLIDEVHPVLVFLNQGTRHEAANARYKWKGIEIESTREFEGVKYTVVKRRWFERVNQRVILPSALVPQSP